MQDSEPTWKFINQVEDDDSVTDSSLSTKQATRVVQCTQRAVKRCSEYLDYLPVDQDGYPSSSHPFPVKHSQIQLGELLGKGSFSNVFDIQCSNDRRIKPGNHVVKVLREDLIQNNSLFAACASGLAVEGTLLANLSHPNIIQLQAYSHHGPEAYSTGKCSSYFLVLERLDEMLPNRIHRWEQQQQQRQQQQKRGEQGLFHYPGFFRMQNELLFRERVPIALELAAAIAYLHNHRIVHRDIKPTNIGFRNGIVKVFDMDVARVLPQESEKLDPPQQLFHLTAKIGTRRYMSPECGLARPYNQQTDVYSFAMVFYELLSLEKPFENCTKREHEVQVFQQGMRPCIPKAWPKPIRKLLKDSWSGVVDRRPTMGTIHKRLSDFLAAEPRGHRGVSPRYNRFWLP